MTDRPLYRIRLIHDATSWTFTAHSTDEQGKDRKLIGHASPELGTDERAALEFARTKIAAFYGLETDSFDTKVIQITLRSRATRQGVVRGVPVYTAVATPEGAMWVIHINGLPPKHIGITQALAENEIELMARDCIACLLDIPEDSFDLTVTKELQD